MRLAKLLLIGNTLIRGKDLDRRYRVNPDGRWRLLMLYKGARLRSLSNDFAGGLLNSPPGRRGGVRKLLEIERKRLLLQSILIR